MWAMVDGARLGTGPNIYKHKHNGFRILLAL